MKKWLSFVVIAVAAIGALGFQAQHKEPEARVTTSLRFEAFDIFLDSGAAPLAAYQVEVKVTGTGETPVPRMTGAGAEAATRITLTGVEGGEHVAYKEPPHYDAAALHEDQLKDRIILAAFNTGADLPTGKTRIARIHVQVEGAEPVFRVVVKAAAMADGTRIEATATAAPAASGESR